MLVDIQPDRVRLTIFGIAGTKYTEGKMFIARALGLKIRQPLLRIEQADYDNKNTFFVQTFLATTSLLINGILELQHRIAE
jgi:hypothetical protein